MNNSIKKAYRKDKKTIVKTMTFVEALANGFVDYKDIDDFIDEWHDGNSTKDIDEFLGMTEEQYKRFAKYHINGLKQMFKKGEINYFMNYRILKKNGSKIHESGIVVHNCDFPGNEKDNVREYFISKYGKNNVCHIGTVGLLKLRGTLKELARLYDISPDEINELTTNGMKDLDKDDEGLSIEELRNKCVALNEFLNKYPEFEKVFDKLYGTINCWGIHAGGMIVTDFDLTKQMPIRVVDGKYVSCWTEGLGGRELGQMGFIKMDILAIDCLDTLEKTIKLINKRHDEHFDLYNIPVDEKVSIDQLNKHDSIGIFQFDSPVATRVIDNIGGVETFEDLSVVNSLARPASLQNQLDKKFFEYKIHPEKIFIPKELQIYMKDTMGLPIYQEAAYFYAKYLADFDKVDSYKLMKNLYKNKLHNQKDIDYWKNKFLKGCKSKIKHNEYVIKFENGISKTYLEDEELLCVDGEKHTIKYIIENNIEIDNSEIK